MPLAVGAAVFRRRAGHVRNASDFQPQGCFGSVDFQYAISRFEVTNSEDASFFDSEAASDSFGLYSTSMETDLHSGILRIGTPKTYTFEIEVGFEEYGVHLVTFFDAVHFGNRIHDGEGSGGRPAPLA